MADPTEMSEVSWPTRRIPVEPGRRCPNADADPSQVVVTAWHNFTGENAEYRRAMGDFAGPPHARVQLEHSCGWRSSLPPVPMAWTYVADAILDHFGTLETAVPRG